jgi:Do/DeqQ family serine protease
VIARRAFGLAALLLGLAVGAHLGPRADPAAAAAFSPAPDAPPPAPGADFSAIAQRVTPSVVNISALQVVRAERSPFYSDPFFREFIGGDIPFRMPLEERKASLGSGVAVSAEGLVVTNNHMIERARQVTVTTIDRRRHRATLLGSDPATDIALLRISGAALTPLSWGDSSRARVGEYVLAIGNPFQLNQTVTMGIISATGRSNVGIVDYEDFIQTDAAINPGNSGGALVNTRGELIGINTAIYSETGGYQGIGFAVPSNLARTVVEQLASHGRVIRGHVGITRISDVTEETARELGLREARGVVVLELLRRSPADRAGLEPGDVVLAVDGREVQDAAQLRNELASATVGTEIELGIVREGRRRSVRIPVEEARPDA